MSKKSFNNRNFVNNQYKQQEQDMPEENQDQNSEESQTTDNNQLVEENTNKTTLPESTEVLSPQVVNTVSKDQQAVQNKSKPTFKNIEASIVTKIESELTNYMEAMDPSKPVNPAEGGQWQYSLLQIIKGILSKTEFSDFSKEWTVLLNFFNKNKENMFNERYMFRFPQNWVGSDVEFSQFRRLVFLAIQTADPKERKKAASHMDLTKATEGLTESQASKILNFYG